MDFTMRIALGVEYDGSQYGGWQRQSHDPNTVQEVLEKAISKVANEPVRVHCAGRTDAGVHAAQQVVHFDTLAERDERAWTLGVNTNLPFDVAVIWAVKVEDDFHARFSALNRSYRYLIYNSPVRQALLSKQVTWYHRPLELQSMQEAANSLLGTHDFTSYRAVACQAKSPVRNLEHIRLQRFGKIIVLDVRANGFLQHMVRNIVGVLFAVGGGDQPSDWAKEVLLAKDRRVSGVTAPPYGLYFVGVGYDAKFALPMTEQPIPVLPIGALNGSGHEDQSLTHS